MIDGIKLLDNLMKAMGAEAVSWRPGPSLTPEQRALINSPDGLDLKLADLESHVCENGMVAIDGRPCVLWIKKTDNPVKSLLEDPLQDGIKRFHVYADCKTMKQMKKRGKYDKYAVGYRQDGKFNVIGTKFRVWQENLKDIKLGVCIHCLRKANHESINNKFPQHGSRHFKEFPEHERRGFRERFNIKDFFRVNGQAKFLKPKFDDATYPNPKKEYGGEYQAAKTTYKRIKKYKCEKCGVDMSQLNYRECSQVHHKSGLSTDNDFSNFELLCCICHSEDHRKKVGSDKQHKKCRKLRIEQNIDKSD